MCECVCRKDREKAAQGTSEYQIQCFHFLGEEMKVERERTCIWTDGHCSTSQLESRVSLDSWVLKRGVKLSCHRPSINWSHRGLNERGRLLSRDVCLQTSGRLWGETFCPNKSRVAANTWT